MSDGGERIDEERSFLARWSARKAEARSGRAPAPEPEPAAATEASSPPGPAEAQRPAPEPELTDADMPAIETLGADSDLSPFFSPKVSEALRRRALRAVFSGAAYNRVDGLDDYAEDFRSFAPLGDVVTAHLKHRLEVARERLARAGGTGAEPSEPVGASGAEAPGTLAAAESEVEEVVEEPVDAPGEEESGQASREGRA